MTFSSAKRNMNREPTASLPGRGLYSAYDVPSTTVPAPGRRRSPSIQKQNEAMWATGGLGARPVLDGRWVSTAQAAFGVGAHHSRRSKSPRHVTVTPPPQEREDSIHLKLKSPPASPTLSPTTAHTCFPHVHHTGEVDAKPTAVPQHVHPGTQVASVETGIQMGEPEGVHIRPVATQVHVKGKPCVDAKIVYNPDRYRDPTAVQVLPTCTCTCTCQCHHKGKKDIGVSAQRFKKVQSKPSVTLHPRYHTHPAAADGGGEQGQVRSVGAVFSTEGEGLEGDVGPQSRGSQTHPPFCLYNVQRTYNTNVPKHRQQRYSEEEQSSRLGEGTTESPERPPFCLYNADRSYNARVPRTLRCDKEGYPRPASSGSRPASSGSHPAGTSSTLSHPKRKATASVQARRSQPKYLTCVDSIPECSSQEIGWMHPNHVMSKAHVESDADFHRHHHYAHAAGQRQHGVPLVAQHVASDEAGETLLAGHTVVARPYDVHGSQEVPLPSKARTDSRWCSPVEIGVQTAPQVSNAYTTTLNTRAMGAVHPGVGVALSGTSEPVVASAVRPPLAIPVARYADPQAQGGKHKIGMACNPTKFGVADCLYWYD